MEIDVQDIDHLGVIAGIVDEIGIVEIINRLLGTHPLEKISAGHVVKAMILNCLGFLTAPLYLFNQFFVGKATEHLIGQGVKPEHLNDSRIGRVLEQLYEKGLTSVFVEIALAAVKRFGVSTKQVHLDGSSICVQGEYLSDQAKTNSLEMASPEQSGEHQELVEAETEENAEPVPIKITHGYSRDYRPDLKQFTLALITSGDGDVPLYFRVGNGNDAEQAIFTEVIEEFQQQWKAQEPEVYVADAALYSEENLQALGATPWISRVPATIAEAQCLMQTLPSELFGVSAADNYALAEVCSTYGGVKQRWLVVQSKSRQQADLKQLDKRIAKAKTKQAKALQKLSTHPFACEADTLDAAKNFDKELKYHRLTDVKIQLKPQYQRPGRPRKGEPPERYTYHLQGTLILDEEAVILLRNQAGRFILATNLLNERLWNSEMILQEYKNQQSCERGFRFLKDPLFFASRMFVKSPQRVAAQRVRADRRRKRRLEGISLRAMIMGLCLLVYSIGQRQLRSSLASLEETVSNQRGQPTKRPTLRWVLQCFQSVHLVWVDARKWSIKLNDSQTHILRFLGSACQKYYFLC
ncbi:MAG: IS1634 family transposase [Cyanobacteria bacterium P01_F01_bin.86]